VKYTYFVTPNSAHFVRHYLLPCPPDPAEIRADALDTELAAAEIRLRWTIARRRVEEQAREQLEALERA